MADDAKDTKAFKKWQGRIDRARKCRKQWEDKFDVEEGERTFLGTTRVKQDMFLNYVAATIKTARPNLFFQSPKFFVRPKSGRQAPAAENVTKAGEGVLEAIAQQNDNLETAGQLALQQAFFRLGVLKVCYDPRLEPNPRQGEPVIATMSNGEPVLDEQKQPVPMKDPLTGQVVTEPQEVMTDEVYRWEWVDAANLLLPDEGPDPQKWTWIGEEIVVPLEDAKEDTRFPKAMRDKFVANKSHGREKPDALRTNDPETEELFEYVEVYDLKQKRLRIWADGQEDQEFLHDDLIPDWIEDHPYALLVLGEKILGPEPLPWPVPVVRDWLPIQTELNIRRNQITQGAKRSARKILYNDGAFPDAEEARKALQSPNDMEAVKVTDVRGVLPITDPDLNGSIYKDIPLLMNDFRVIAGQTGARQANPDADTATEATYVERAANLRESDAQQIIIRWMSTAGQKMFQCVKATLTLDLWIQMRGLDDVDVQAYIQTVYKMPPEILSLLPGLKDAIRQQAGQQHWVRITRSDLAFEADVTVAPGSNRPPNLDVERRQWLEFLRIIAQAPQLLMSPMLLKRTMEMYSMRDESLVQELVALSEKMTQVAANQAGRNQGAGAAPSGAAPPAGEMVNALLSQVTGGSR